MGRQIKQVLITYVTHYWVMAGLALGFGFFVVPQFLVALRRSTSPTDALPMITMFLGMPLFFLPLMIVPQVKAQFAHPRSALTPHFARPHVTVAAGVLLLLVLVYPAFVALCFRLSPLGVFAWAGAIAATTIWARHVNRFMPMLIALVVLYSTMTPAGANWWLLDGNSQWVLHALVALIAVALIAAWLVRVCQLREEMDDYQNPIRWPAARSAGRENSEQRSIIAQQVRRNKLAAWISDRRLAGVGRYHEGNPVEIARLLRLGFASQPAVIGGLIMAVMFGAMTLFMAYFSFAARPNAGGIAFYMQMAAIIPGIAGEYLARRRPRLTGELMLPLSRPQLIRGLFAATIWNGAAVWLVMNAGLVLVTWATVHELLTPKFLGTMLLLTAGGSFGLCGLTIRVAIWPSMIKRLALIFVATLPVMEPIFIWPIGRERLGDRPFLLLAAVLIAVGAALLYNARRAWLRLELG